MTRKLSDEKQKACQHTTFRGLKLTQPLKFNNCLESSNISHFFSFYGVWARASKRIKIRIQLHSSRHSSLPSFCICFKLREIPTRFGCDKTKVNVFSRFTSDLIVTQQGEIKRLFLFWVYVCGFTFQIEKLKHD